MSTDLEQMAADVTRPLMVDIPAGWYTMEQIIDAAGKKPRDKTTRDRVALLVKRGLWESMEFDRGYGRKVILYRRKQG